MVEMPVSSGDALGTTMVSLRIQLQSACFMLASFTLPKPDKQIAI